jgi:TolB-like protein/DNA-binding winged helix-turn-helix (wHTH) protein
MDAPVTGGVLAFEAWRYDPRAGGLLRQDPEGKWVPVQIGARARDILAFLLQRPGELVSKDALLDAAWPNMAVESNNLTVQIAALRRVLDERRGNDSCIQTVPGRGYRFVLAVMRLGGEQPELAAAALAEPVTPPPVARPRHPPRHWLVAGSFVVGVAMLLAVVTWSAGWFASRTPTPRLSLVVLPIQNLSHDPKEDYIAAGITDDLTTELSHIPGAFVISGSSARTYKNNAIDARTIGDRLGVRYVLEGSMHRLGDILRVNAELVSTETDAQLWSDNFDQQISDLAAGQEQIVIRMRSALNISLTDIEAARSLRERPTNADAFDLILRARAISWLPQTKDTVSQTLSLYEQALERDPNSVLALTGAVNALLNGYYFGAMPYDAVMKHVEQYLGHAKTLAPNSERVLETQAAVLDYRLDGLDYRHALPELKAVGQKLIDLYPNNDTGYFRCMSR